MLVSGTAKKQRSFVWCHSRFHAWIFHYFVLALRKFWFLNGNSNFHLNVIRTWSALSIKTMNFIESKIYLFFSFKILPFLLRDNFLPITAGFHWLIDDKQSAFNLTNSKQTRNWSGAKDSIKQLLQRVNALAITSDLTLLTILKKIKCRTHNFQFACDNETSNRDWPLM